eukprot:c10784_g1_i3.p1 GENE.c10784_g1_i3~~c10784_g1_i3.p1  ORF type:complete len:223 (+),score=36.58 c10784_g1_i3:632-1300(+)
MECVARGKHISILCGGTGITPFISLIWHALSNRANTATFSLVTFNKTENDVLLLESLAALARMCSNRLDVSHIVTKGIVHWAGGLATDPLRDRSFSDSLFVCGPPEFCLEAERAVKGSTLVDIVVFSGHVAASVLEGGVGSEPVQEYTLDAVKAKKTWMVLWGDVLDVTNFVLLHPGGEVILKGCAAGDGTALFEQWHTSDSARAAAKLLVVGRCAMRESSQ